MPEFEIPDLSKLKITKPVVKVGEKEVDESVEKIARENVGTKIVKAKRPAKLGDTVVIDFLGKLMVYHLKVARPKDII